MKVIGLTGGIGAGKSTVSEFLAEAGYLIIDADRMAREITGKGSPVLQRIAEAFGDDMLFPDGSLDRKKLAAVVFSDRKKRQLLESMTTKEVIRMIGEQVAQLRRENKEKLIFVDAPLLFETGADRLTDFVWLVTADQQIRISRVMKRDNATEEQVLARIASQMDAEAKAARSTEIIDNSKGKEELYRRVEYLLEKYAETE